MTIIRLLKDDSALQMSQSLQAATFPRSANFADMVFDGNPGDKVLHRHLCSFTPGFIQTVLSLVFAFFTISAAQAQVTLPIEVMGAEGTEVNVTLSLTAGQVAATQRLWLQTHNIRYPEKASFRINGGAWVPLNNTTATMLPTSQTYGGIGGSFAVLKMTLPVTPSQLVTGNNTLTFRFNVSNGLAVGYRIVKLNLLDAGGTQLMPASAFTQENPATWLPPSSASADIVAGENLWRNAPLMASYRPGAQPLMAKCASCHTQNGADLQYFSYSNHTIIERSKFHGLSATQGSQIASYIRNLAVKKAGRPWNPPYQPGPGLTDKPNDEWLAGAGIDSVPDDDSDTLLAMFPNGVRRDALMEGDTNKFKRFSSHDTLLAFQLPDWNHWLPEIHPLDGMPQDFSTSKSLKAYNDLRTQLVGKTAAETREWMRTSNAGQPRSGMFLLTDLYGDAPHELLRARRPELFNASGSISDSAAARQVYSWILWRMVKHVEIHEEFALTGLGKEPDGVEWANYDKREALPRMWLGANRTVFDSSPFLSGSEFNITGSASGNNAFNHNYLSNAWYQLQLMLNGGQRTGGGHGVVDFGYAHGFLNGFQRDTGYTQMGRNYVWSLKGMDEGDNDRGPNHNMGWSFNRASIGPVAAYLAPEKPASIPALSSFSKDALSLLVQVWLEKNNSWLPEQIFTYPDGTEKSGDEDGVNFNDRFYVVGGGVGDPNRSIPHAKYTELGLMKSRGTLPPALQNGYAQWAQVIWPGLDANGTARNNWMQFVYPRVGTAPSAPPLQNAATYGDIRVSWTPAAGVTSYNVKRSTTAAGPFLTVAYFRTSGEYTDSVPLQNREYYYKLSANAAAGESSDSPATLSALLHNRLLGTFIGTTPTSGEKTREATDGDRHTIASSYNNGSWTGLDLGTAQPITRLGFVPQRAYSIRSIGGKFQASNSATFSSGVVDLHIIVTDPGDGYEEKVISVGGTYRYVRYLIPTGNRHDGQIAEITFWKGSIPAALAVPTGLTAISGNGQVVLSWSASSGATSYTLKRSTTNGGPYTDVVSQAGTSFTNTGLTNGTTYYYVVSASNGGGSSGNSTQASTTPTGSASDPVITSVLTQSATVGTAMSSYTIAASNSPTSYGASNLPAGLSVNTSTGVISGTPTTAGSISTAISATNEGGTGSASLVFTVNSSGGGAPVKLNGTVIETPGSWGNGGNTRDKALDGDTNTYFDAATSNGNWVGLDLGTAHVITQVRYFPRSDQAGRMDGGIFQGSNSADFSSGVTTLHTISGIPPVAYTSATISNSTSFRYVRYLSPIGGYGNVAEVEFYRPAAPVIISALTRTATVGTAISNYTITASNSPTSYNASNLPAGLSVSTSTGVISGTPATAGSVSTTISATNAGGSGSATLVFTIGSAPTDLANFRATHNLASNGFQDILSSADDGVANLLKYAFNMIGGEAGQVNNLMTSNTATLQSNGSAGLPFVSVNVTGELQITFIRRKATSNSGITYVVEFSDTLATGSWAVNPAATEISPMINGTLERVTITDSEPAIKRFARVRVTEN